MSKNDVNDIRLNNILSFDITSFFRETIKEKIYCEKEIQQEFIERNIIPTTLTLDEF